MVTSGGDGLAKLWNVNTAECVATLDEHEDRVWALATGGESESLLATGSADGRIVLWRDCTASEAAEAAEEDAALQLRSQELDNALRVGFLAFWV